MRRRLAFLAALLLLQSSPRCCSVGAKCVLFNFGDSNSDTGSLWPALGLYLPPPYGRRLFSSAATSRASDGRLYIDFICEGLKIGYLSPYMESSGVNFSHGTNFAVAGAAVGNQRSQNPFPLPIQVNQFLHFKNRTAQLRPIGSGSMISEEEFGDAVYSLDIIQNDIMYAFQANLSSMHVRKAIVPNIARIRDAIQTLYTNGARKFLIYNTGPFGCLPFTLAARKNSDSKLDRLGCLSDYNRVAEAFNARLNQLCDWIRAKHKDATIVYTNMYSIKYDLFANHIKYGFQNPLMACCGHGGPPYNSDHEVNCGMPAVMACPVTARHIIWDGIHYTEDANKIIASKILSAKYSKPRIKLTTLCK